MVINGQEIRIFDSGYRFKDRYTLVINNDVFAMSDNPQNSAIGVFYYCGKFGKVPVGNGLIPSDTWGNELNNLEALHPEAVKYLHHYTGSDYQKNYFR